MLDFSIQIHIRIKPINFEKQFFGENLFRFRRTIVICYRSIYFKKTWQKNCNCFFIVHFLIGNTHTQVIQNCINININNNLNLITLCGSLRYFFGIEVKNFYNFSIDINLHPKMCIPSKNYSRASYLMEKEPIFLSLKWCCSDHFNKMVNIICHKSKVRRRKKKSVIVKCSISLHMVTISIKITPFSFGNLDHSHIVHN